MNVVPRNEVRATPTARPSKRFAATQAPAPRRSGLPKVTCIQDLRRLGRKRAPKMFFDYVEGGSFTESTLRANVDDFAAIKLRQRVAIDMADRNLAVDIAGEPASMPIALAPTGLTGMLYPDGEILAARAAAEVGVPYTLSTMSICSIEDLADHVDRPFWFQVYVMRDRAFIDRLIDRAEAAGCTTLVLTLDLQIMAQRHNDVKNGLSCPPRMTLRNIADLATKPRWCLGMLRTKRRTFGNVVGHASDVSDLRSLSAWTTQQFDPTLDWSVVRRIRDRWKGTLVLKGILDPRDAEIAAETGANALVVSNHGGRQLDGARSSIEALPEIVTAVGDKIELMMDGGIRTGQDALRALALGAKSVLIGRAFLYGLAAAGEAGVAQSLAILRNELDTTMAMCGLKDVRDAGPDILYRAP